jgi:hypothetical protein
LPGRVYVEGLAGFHDVQDANESLLDVELEGEMAGHVLLGQRGLCDTLVRSSGAAGDSLGMTLDLGGTVLDEDGEVLVQDMVGTEEPLECHDVADRTQGASEDQPVKAAEYTDYSAAVSLKKLVHGRSFQSVQTRLTLTRTLTLHQRRIAPLVKFGCGPRGRARSLICAIKR